MPELSPPVVHPMPYGADQSPYALYMVYGAIELPPVKCMNAEPLLTPDGVANTVFPELAAL